MMERTRLLACLLTAGLLASCGGSSNELATRKDAHVPQSCNGLTPGFWCGGATTATPGSGKCESVGFEDCDQMCTCFHEANAKVGVNSEACGPTACSTGMEDVLVKFWAAFQLSFAGTFNEFYCPAADCGSDGFCDAADVQDILEGVPNGCDRERQEAAKDCLDTILNTGGTCALFPVPAS